MEQRGVEGFLERARCPSETCELVRKLERSGHASEALPQLASYRLSLLEEARETDRRLDCLDQAIRTITRQDGK